MRAMVTQFLAMFWNTGESKHIGLIQMIELSEDDDKEEFMQELEQYRSKTITEKGCHRFDILQDEEKENLYYTYRVFENMNDLIGHRYK